MARQFLNPSLDECGPWMVTTHSGARAFYPTAQAALWAAYESSAHAMHVVGAPLALQRLGSDERLGAKEVVAEWRNMGWPLPAPPVRRSSAGQRRVVHSRPPRRRVKRKSQRV
ncbi:MAG: hypothetical protein JSS29_07655 [Proteobacteria bacterium]|nr:hypothetical protein [Pseudomonadota bacterium]